MIFLFIASKTPLVLRCATFKPGRTCSSTAYTETLVAGVIVSATVNGESVVKRFVIVRKALVETIAGMA